MPENKIDNIYNFLQTKKVKLPKDIEEFATLMGDDEKRGKVYDFLKKNKVKLPENNEAFGVALGLKKKEPTPISGTDAEATSQSSQTTVQDVPYSVKEGIKVEEEIPKGQVDATKLISPQPTGAPSGKTRATTSGEEREVQAGKELEGILSDEAQYKLEEGVKVEGGEGEVPYSTKEGVKIEHPEKEKDPLGFMDRLSEVEATELMPFLSGAKETGEIARLLQAANNVKENKETNEDLLILKKFQDKGQQDTDFFYDVTDLMLGLPAFAGELLTTGGIYTGVKKATVKGGKEVLQKVLKDKTGDFLKKRLVKFGGKAAAGIAGATAQTIPAGVTRISAKSLENMLPDVKIEKDDVDAFNAEIVSEGDTPLKATSKAFAEQWIETVSEKSGGMFRSLGRGAKEGLIKRGLLTSILKANPNVKPSKLIKGIRASGYDGILEEMGEERLGEVGRAVILGEEYNLPSARQLGVELVSFGVPGLMVQGLKAGEALKKQRDEKKAIEKEQGIKPKSVEDMPQESKDKLEEADEKLEVLREEVKTVEDKEAKEVIVEKAKEIKEEKKDIIREYFEEEEVVEPTKPTEDAVTKGKVEEGGEPKREGVAEQLPEKPKDREREAEVEEARPADSRSDKPTEVEGVVEEAPVEKEIKSIEDLESVEKEEGGEDKILKFFDKAIEATSTKGKAFEATLGIPITVANASLKIIKASYVGGKSLAQAVEKGYKYINDYLKGKGLKEITKNEFDGLIKDITKEPGEVKQTSKDNPLNEVKEFERVTELAEGIYKSGKQTKSEFLKDLQEKSEVDKKYIDEYIKHFSGGRSFLTEARTRKQVEKDIEAGVERKKEYVKQDKYVALKQRIKEKYRNIAKGKGIAQKDIKAFKEDMAKSIESVIPTGRKISKSIAKQIAKVTPARSEALIEKVKKYVETEQRREGRSKIKGRVQSIAKKIKKEGKFTNKERNVAALISSGLQDITDVDLQNEVIEILEALDKRGIAKVRPEKIGDFLEKIDELSDKVLANVNELDKKETTVRGYDSIKKSVDTIKNKDITDLNTAVNTARNAKRIETGLGRSLNEGKITEEEYSGLINELETTNEKLKSELQEYTTEANKESKKIISDVDRAPYDVEQNKMIDQLQEVDVIDAPASASKLEEIALNLEAGYIPTKAVADYITESEAIKGKALGEQIESQIDKQKAKDKDTNKLLKLMFERSGTKENVDEIERFLKTQGVEHIESTIGIHKDDANITKKLIAPHLTRAANRANELIVELKEKVEKSFERNFKEMFSIEKEAFQKASLKIGAIRLQAQEDGRLGRSIYEGTVNDKNKRKEYRKEGKEIKLMDKVYEDLPMKEIKDDSGKVIGKKVDVEKAIAGLNRREKAVYKTIDEVFNTLRPLQKIANERSGKPFLADDVYLPNVRLDRIKQEIEDAKMLGKDFSGQLKTKADVGKAKIDFSIGAFNHNAFELVNKAIKETAIDYEFSHHNAIMNKMLNNIIANTDNSIQYAKALKTRLNDAADFNFSVNNYTIVERFFQKALMAQYAKSLVRVFRIPVEFLVENVRTIGSVPKKYVFKVIRKKYLERAMKTVRILKDKTTFEKLLRMTSSPFLKRMDKNLTEMAESINKGYIAQASQRLLSLPDRATMEQVWMPNFMGEFNRITGQEFNYEKFNKDKAYSERHKQAILDAAAVADKETSIVKGSPIKAAQRTKIPITPKWVKGGYDLDARHKNSSYATYMSTFAAIENLAVVKNLKEVVYGDTKSRKEAATAVAAQLASGTLYGLGMQAAWLTEQYILALAFGAPQRELDDIEEEYEKLYSVGATVDNTISNIMFLATGKYGQTARIATLLLFGMGDELTSTIEDKKVRKKVRDQLKAFSRSRYYADPINLSGYGKNMDIVKLGIPQIELMWGTAAESLKSSASILQKAGEFKSLSEQEKMDLEVYKLMNNMQKLLLMRKGTQIPFQSAIDKYLRKKEQTLKGKKRK